MRVVIIGGGIIGVSTAHYLSRDGHDVVVLDRSELSDGCSFGNAGMIVPSHVIPLASPGMITRGVRWLFSRTSPFYIHPRLSKNLIRWAWLFYRHATPEHVAFAAPAIKNLSLLSRQLYRQLAEELPFDFGFAERGLLMLYQSEQAEREEAEAAHFASSLGIEARILSAPEVERLESFVPVRVRGGVYYPGDAHLIPQRLMPQWIDHLRKQGVVFKAFTEVRGFSLQGRKVVAAQTNLGDVSGDAFVLAAGTWSGNLAARLQLSLPLQGGKGYGFSVESEKLTVQIPSILVEARVAVTPMGETVRLGGTLEIAGTDQHINMRRVQGIVGALPSYYPGVRISLPLQSRVWTGMRPCSPDGLPFIGRTGRLSNLLIATGHAMMGLSLGPATGKLIAELLRGCEPSVDLKAFDPDRFA